MSSLCVATPSPTAPSKAVVEEMELVDRLRRQDGLTVLSTLHDLTLAGQYADRLALLSEGRVVAEGAPTDVLTPAALSTHYGARAEVIAGPNGPTVMPVRARG